MIACKGRVGILGATSIIGECLLPLLIEEGWEVVAFSRRKKDQQRQVKIRPVDWQLLRKTASSNVSNILTPEKQISHWICLAPIWVLPEYFSLLSLYGVQHVVAISSTSRFTKGFSSDPGEQALAERLANGEERLVEWVKTKDVTWTILRPTLTYGLGRDSNISVIARFIRRFAFFPFLGAALGLRQPVHTQDVAWGCLAALSASAAINRCYNISGGEIITYREMICRIFSALGRKPHFVTFPLWFFRLAVLFLRMFPSFRHWSTAMAERMNKDLVFDHEDARRNLGFSPRTFQLSREDLPR